jgi:hypothetical protein
VTYWSLTGGGAARGGDFPTPEFGARIARGEVRFDGLGADGAG